MDPNAAFDDVDPFAGLEARLADSFDDELSEFDYARTDEQAQAEIEATMDRLRRRAAQPRADHDATAVADPSARPAETAAESATHSDSQQVRAASPSAGLRILDEELDLDVDAGVTHHPAQNRTGPAPQTRVPGSAAPTNLVINEPADETVAPASPSVEQGFVEDLVPADDWLPDDPGDGDSSDRHVSDGAEDLDGPLFVATSVEEPPESVPAPTFAAVIGDGTAAPSRAERVADDPVPAAEELVAEEPAFAPAEFVAEELAPEAFVPDEPAAPVQEPDHEVSNPSFAASLAEEPTPIPGTRIPDTRLATVEQMAESDRRPIPRLAGSTETPDTDSGETRRTKTRHNKPAKDSADPDETLSDLDEPLPDSIDHLIPDRERPPLLVYLLLTALTLAALGALLWYTSRSTEESVGVVGTAAAAAEPDVAADAEPEASAAEPAEAEATDTEPAPAPPAGLRLDDLIPDIATAVDRCDEKGLLGTLRSSAEVTVAVDLRIDFVDSAGAVYYTVERATGAIDPGQAVNFTFVLVGEPLEEKYVGVEPAECRFAITGVFAA